MVIYYNISKANPGLNVTVRDIDYGEHAIINVELIGVNNEMLNGVVVVNINGKDYNVTINSGDGESVVDIIAVGNYPVNAYWAGNGNYNNVTNSTSFNVSQNHVKLGITVTNETYGTNSTIIINLIGVLNEGLNETVTVTINNKNYTIEVKNGIGTGKVDVLAVNGYEAFVKWNGNQNYTNNSGKVSFNVFKVSPILVFDVDNVTYGFNSTVYVELYGVLGEALNGTVTIKFNGSEYTFELENGYIMDYTNVLSVGNYTASVYWDGNENYTNIITFCNFSVSKIPPSLDVVVSDVIYGNQSIITVRLTGYMSVGLNGTVVVTIAGKDYIIDVVNGTGSGIVDIIAAGNYTASGYWAGDQNYSDVSDSFNFHVYKATPTVNVTVEDVVYGNKALVNIIMTGVLDEKLNGTVIVTINNKNYTVDIRNGTGSTYIDIINVGNYEVIANWLEIANYTSSSNKTSFNVTQAKASLVVVVSDVIYGNKALITVYLDGVNGEKLNGTVTVTVNNKDYSVVVSNGVGTGYTDILNVNTYSVFAKWTGNNNYIGSTNTTNFKVTQAKSNLVVEVNDVIYGTNATITVYLDGVNGEKLSGTVVVTINDKDYSVVVSNGIGTGYVDILSVDSYSVLAKWDGNNNYLSSSNTTSFKVSQANATLVVVVSDVVYGNKALITVYLDGVNGEKLSGTVVVAINDKDYSVVVSNGIGTGYVDILSVDTYSVLAKWDGNNNYLSSSNTTSFKVSQANATLVVVVSDVIYGTNATITVYLDGVNGEKLSGTVVVTINDKDYSVVVSDGVGTGYVDVLDVGSYSVLAKWDGNNNYKEVTNTTNFIVSRANATLDVVVSNVTYGNQAVITVNLIGVNGEGLNGTVVVTINGKEYLIEINKGIGSTLVDYLGANTYGVTAYWSGNNNYNEITNGTNFVVSKADSTIVIKVVDIIEGEVETIYVELTGVNGELLNGTVVVTINDKKYSINIVNGKGSVDVSDLTSGKYSVTGLFAGNDNYNGVSGDASFVVNPKIDTSISSDLPSFVFVGDDVIVNISVSPSDVSGNVSIYVNGELWDVVNLVDGLATYTFNFKSSGDYEVKLVYNGDKTHMGSSVSKVVSAKSKAVKIITSDMIKYYSNGEKFEALLLNDTVPVVGVEVIFTINGRSYTRITDENGVASIAINLNPGSYVILTTYGNSTVSNNITVLNTIVSSDLVKIYKNDSQFVVKLLDKDGNALINTNVIFNINGVFYNRLTNDEGITFLNINLNAGEYIITTYNNVTGEVHSNNISVISSISSSDVTMYYKSGQYIATFLNSDGTPLINTGVVFNINGVFYNRTTDSNGVAYLNINLLPGDYIITAYNPSNGELISNVVKVLPVLFGEDLEMNYGEDRQYEVKLVNGHGMPLAGETIEMNINGVFYYKVTDFDGIARLNIRLLPGEYIITSSWGDALTSNIVVVH